jgi:hypothetical protein
MKIGLGAAIIAFSTITSPRVNAAVSPVDDSEKLPEKSPRRLIEELYGRMAGLSVEQKMEATLAFVATTLEEMTLNQITDLRAEVIAEFGVDHEFVDLIDGHLALREVRILPNV